jgi:hypothetical protein
MSTAAAHSGRTVVVVSADQLSADLADEAAVLNLASGQYYTLDAVGATIWRFVHEPRTIADIQMRVLSEYDVDADRCAGDVAMLIDALQSEGLVRVTPGAD